MSKFSDAELKQRAFERIAWVLKHFYDEQEDDYKRTHNIKLHSGVFEHLIFDEQIFIGKSEASSNEANSNPPYIPYREHIVPCAYIRDRAFEKYAQGKTMNDVASMVGRLLKIAHITPNEANLIDTKYKYTMPKDWDCMKDAPTRRLDDAGIKLIGEIDMGAVYGQSSLPQ